MSPRPSKNQQIPNLQEMIKETAWQQISESGAAAISLRAIARELNITAPAIYNYFPNRDELVTALIVDAFNSLAEAQENILKQFANRDPAEQFRLLGLAYREWAVTYPQRYQLIFGTPIPRYHAPDDVTAPAATRSLVPLIQVIQTIYTLRKPVLDCLPPMTPALENMLKQWQAAGTHADLEVLYLTLVVWSRVHGLVLMEIGKQLPPFISEPAEIYQREIESISIQYNLGD